MTPRPLFVDTNVLLYAVGAAHPRQAACAAVLRAARDDRVRLHCSAELVQEFLFHRMRRGPAATAIDQTRAVRRVCVVHPVDDDVLDRALDLVAAGGAGGRDALHAATALVHGFDRIVTCDSDFADVDGLGVLDPADV